MPYAENSNLDTFGPQVQVFHEIPRNNRFHVPLTETEAMVAAVSDPSVPNREQLMIDLVSKRRRNTDDIAAAALAERSDLDYEDVQQMAALAILGAARQLPLIEDTKMDQSNRLSADIPRHIKGLVQQTKLVAQVDPSALYTRSQKHNEYAEHVEVRSKLDALIRGTSPEDDFPDLVELADTAKRLLSDRTLTHAEYQTVVMRFGTGGIGAHTFAEVSSLLGISREAARKLEASALWKMRAADKASMPETTNSSGNQQSTSSKPSRFSPGLARDYTQQLRATKAR